MIRLLRFVAVAILAFCASSCATTKPPVIVEKPVIVERTVYVAIDPGLTAHGQIPDPANDGGRELLNVAALRREALKVCHGKLDSIATVQGTEVKP